MTGDEHGIKNGWFFIHFFECRVFGICHPARIRRVRRISWYQLDVACWIGDGAVNVKEAGKWHASYFESFLPRFHVVVVAEFTDYGVFWYVTQG